MNRGITAERLRSISNDLMTLKAAAEALRRHRVRYETTPDGDALRVRTRSGYVFILRSGSRSASVVVVARTYAGRRSGSAAAARN